MLVISRKIGQKIMLNDNIVITIADIKNGQCKIAIEADKDVKIYREEIYYQIYNIDHCLRIGNSLYKLSL